METKKFEISVKSIAVSTTKLVIGTAAGIGAYIVAKNFLHEYMNPNAKKLTKLAVVLGVGALATAVGEVASNEVEKEIDFVSGAIDSVSKAIDRFVGKEKACESCTDETVKEN